MLLCPAGRQSICLLYTYTSQLHIHLPIQIHVQIQIQLRIQIRMQIRDHRWASKPRVCNMYSIQYITIFCCTSRKRRTQASSLPLYTAGQENTHLDANLIYQCIQLLFLCPSFVKRCEEILPTLKYFGNFDRLFIPLSHATLQQLSEVIERAIIFVHSPPMSHYVLYVA